MTSVHLEKNTKEWNEKFSFIEEISPDKVAEFIKNQNPQVITIILFFCKTEFSREVLKNLPFDMQMEIVPKLYSIENINTDVLQIMVDTLYEDFQMINKGHINPSSSSKTNLQKILSIYEDDIETQKKIQEINPDIQFN